MKVVCNYCSKTFDSSKIKLKTKALEGDIKETGYKCPKCKGYYKVCITNAEIRELQKEIREKHAAVNRMVVKGVDVTQENEEIDKLNIKHKVMMDALNRR